MTLKNDKINGQLTTGNGQRIRLSMVYCLLPIVLLFAGCYSFKDIGSIPQDVKTYRVQLIENRARYVNPILSPQITDKLRQKITGQTRLTGVQTDDAHYDIGGTITGYNVTTSAISDQQAAGQRLTVTVHVVFKNNLDPSKNFEADVSRNFDYSANLTITQAEAQLNETIIKNVVDEIFNRIFSNW
ncbi:LPS assembly lipoprotein LptE [Longitalea luteola]|uniref:LPS assembly lipoprotein LptE n=1 Tax=Longitalea luteola TaxID=2812563 RepID=UPI001F618FFB|nr:LptE family protein [Longitalea luteola]